jgi:hypothetical protein
VVVQTTLVTSPELALAHEWSPPEATSRGAHVATEVSPAAEHVVNPDTVYPASQPGAHDSPTFNVVLPPQLSLPTPALPLTGFVTAQFAPSATVETAVGVSLFVVVPSPSWPCSLFPQHLTEPSSSPAHMCQSPENTLVAEVKSNAATGILLK